MADEGGFSQGTWRNEFLRSQPFQRGGFPLLPERAFAAVEAVAAAGEFEKLDGDVVHLHSGNELAAVLGWDGFVVMAWDFECDDREETSVGFR